MNTIVSFMSVFYKILCSNVERQESSDCFLFTKIRLRATILWTDCDNGKVFSYAYIE